MTIALQESPMLACQLKAESVQPGFSERAARHILHVLAWYGPRSGEQLVDHCLLWGIKPHDDRAFGSVFAKLSRDGKIKCVGYCLRKRGHGAAGGRVWAFV